MKLPRPITPKPAPKPRPSTETKLNRQADAVVARLSKPKPLR